MAVDLDISGQNAEAFKTFLESEDGQGASLGLFRAALEAYQEFLGEGRPEESSGGLVPSSSGISMVGSCINIALGTVPVDAMPGSSQKEGSRIPQASHTESISQEEAKSMDYRISRAREAGRQAKLVLDGKLEWEKVAASPGAVLENRVWVVLRGHSPEATGVYRRWRDARPMVCEWSPSRARCIMSPSSVHHAFPSVAEARAYGQAAGFAALEWRGVWSTRG